MSNPAKVTIAKTGDGVAVARGEQRFFVTAQSIGDLGAGGGPHATDHEDGGTDEISVLGLSGLLADAQTPLLHAAAHQNGGGDEINVAALSGLLADAQTPLLHAAAHQNGGGDEINVAGLSGVLADGQPVTVQDEGVNVTATPHTVLDFVGSGVTATDGGGGVATITIPGGAGQNAFETVAGDSGSAVADSPTDTLSLIGATNGGITTVGSSTPDQVTFGLTTIDLATGAAILALGDFISVNDAADAATTLAQKYTFTDMVQDLDIPNAISVNGLVTRTAADAYASRSIVASALEDFLGISVVDSDGAAGDPTVGIDIVGLTDPAADMAATDEYIVHDKSEGTAGATRKMTGQNVADGATILAGPNLFESVAADIGGPSVALTRTDTLTLQGAAGIGTLSIPASNTIQFNIETATETTEGGAEIATQAETDTGTDDLRFVTPLKLATKPLALHASAHENAGSDEISVAGLSGLLADNQNPVPATEILVGGAEIATQAEVDAGTDDTRFVTPLKMKTSPISRPSRIVSFILEDPTGSDLQILQHKFGEAVTISRISASCDTGTVTLQFDERVETTPNTGGTDVMTAVLVADTNTEVTTAFANATIAADAILNLDIDSITGAPTVVRIHVEFKPD